MTLRWGNRILPSITKVVFLGALLAISASGPGFALADDDEAPGLSEESYSNLIKKLESTLPSIADYRTKTSVQLRIGDLYADRARLLAMKEVEKSCDSCLGSKSERKKALGYYSQVVSGLRGEQRSRITLQLAHLNSLNGDLKATEKIFQGVLREERATAGSQPENLVAESYIGLGEIRFFENKYKDARGQYEKALAIGTERNGHVKHRLSWCWYYDGQAPKAQALLFSSLEKDELTDDLRKDMSRDLATFVATVGINEGVIQRLLAATPESHKKSNLYYLGQEADRLGKREAAVLVWNVYEGLNGVTEDEGLEIQVRKAQSLLDDGALTGSLAAYKAFYKSFGARNCAGGSKCDEVHDRSRSYLTSWIKKEKTEPSAQLQDALQTYSENNLNDIEMLQWTGHVSKYHQEYREAYRFYRQAALAGIAGAKGPGSEPANIRNTMFAAIEMAEDTRDRKLQREAFNFFLEHRPDDDKADEVRYQLAYLDYTEKSFAKAAEAFHSLTASQKLESGLKLQAANLSLDCLADLKNDSQSKEVLEQRAKEYVARFPKQKNEFAAISRKAGVNNALNKFYSGKRSEGAAKEALLHLNGVTLIGATAKDTLNILKNRMTLAEAGRDLGAVDTAASSILTMNQATPEDRQLAMKQRLWVAEAQMNFTSAYRLAQKMELNHLSPENRHLKLALLADLSFGMTAARKHYEAYIKAATSLRKKNLVRAKFVREAKSPWTEFKRFRNDLAGTPDILADVLVDLFALDFDIEKVRPYLQQKGVRQTASAGILYGFLEMEEVLALKKKFRRQDLNARTDAQLARSLKDRMALLKDTEKKAEWAVRNSGFRVQISLANILGSEYERLHKDLLALPVPRGLKASDRSRYQDLMQKKAAPFADKAKYFADQAEDLWSSSAAWKDMVKSAQTIKGSHAKVLAFELNNLKALAERSGEKSAVEDALESIPKPDRKEIQRLRQEVIANPFDADKITELKQLEELNGQTTMVAYLEARLNSQGKSSGGRR
jgi:hypothetical protein